MKGRPTRPPTLDRTLRRTAPLVLAGALATPESGAARYPADFPLVPEDVVVSLFARDPLVRNPCAITFDRKGRLCVGMGPQYRNPRPDTPGDSVWILTDADDDGAADGRVRFATGFNSIQGLAWRGGDLWVANAPDLTLVRDLDGDDEADEYVRLYTDLGNLEHGLHGLNVGPDGKVYFSKGNSKGLTRPPDRVAPLPFRQLWGVTVPPGTPDFPPPVVFTKDNYEKNYHDPADDWGRCGGILRCDPDGAGLEIVSWGFRNPWDISFDDGFDWLGTDNDQTHGDKLFSPFFGAHFGWGHPWSYDWKGDDHLPSAPSAGPLFEGSGTGVIYCGLGRYPERYRGVFLVNDWLRRQVYIYRPSWKGAWMQPANEPLEILAEAGGGRSMPRSSGRSFDPVDIEIGPDGAIYTASWGRVYGARYENGKLANEGRIYRLWPAAAPPVKPPQERDPWADLGSHLPAWRTDAQEAIIAMGTAAAPRLKAILRDPATAQALQTWAAWTLGRAAPRDPFLAAAAGDTNGPLNLRLQALRILGQRGAPLPATVRASLQDTGARVRHEAVLAIRQAGERRWAGDVVDLAAGEEDRVVFYSAWGALRDLLERGALVGLLEEDERPRVRLAALLALLEDDALEDDAIQKAAQDADPAVAAIARRRLGGVAAAVVKGPPLDLRSGRSPPAHSAPSATHTVTLPPPPYSLVDKIVSESGRRYSEATLAPGALAYHDRGYRFTDVPDELVGETFIRGSNNDADPASGTSLTLHLRYPSTVFLADDARGEKLPRWAEGVFQTTGMKIRTDEATHKVYRADFPAGKVVFGPNREGVRARKGNYVVIVRPRLLHPPAKPSTLADVLPLLARADPVRGRALYFSKAGANCALCHRLEGHGNIYAPDLADIGQRAEAEFVVRSILEPSADITEGFALRSITKKTGETVGGIIVEETARQLRIATPGGAVVTVPTAEVARRETADVSAMPPTFSALLMPQQVADLTAYLRAPKAAGAKPSTPPRNAAAKAAAATREGAAPTSEKAVAPPPTQAGPDPLAGRTFGRGRGFQEFFLRVYDDRLTIALAGRPVASYYYRHPRTKRPFFAHLTTPAGVPVTRAFPPVEGADGSDHPFMHPGLSLGFATLGGENFWHNNRGVVVHEGFLGEPRAGAASAAFAVRNRYLGARGQTVCMEEARFTFRRNADGYLISLENRFAHDRPFAFGVKEEMGLALRVATPLRVRGGNGRILSAKGGRDEKGTWGIVDNWWDYSGTAGGRAVGVQLMSGPGNPPVWSHSRDYGVLVANPFPVDRAPNRGKKVTVEPGRPLLLRFGVQVHGHAAPADYDPAAAYTRYLNTAGEN